MSSPPSYSTPFDRMYPYETLSVPGVIESTAQIREVVKRAALEAGIDKKRSYRLQLAVDEIATNIVIHGYQENGLQGEITVIAEISDEALTITLEDTAIPFNPFSLPPPDNLFDPLEERPMGGYGVYLTINSVDRFDYEQRSGRNRNIFTILRQFSPPLVP